MAKHPDQKTYPWTSVTHRSALGRSGRYLPRGYPYRSCLGCEQKAATSCISLIQRYSEKDRLVQDLSPIVTEEWGHFRLVLAELQKRGLKLGRQRKDVYVNRLMEFQQKGGNEDERFLDRLLIFALIEARSCERLQKAELKG